MAALAAGLGVGLMALTRRRSSGGDRLLSLQTRRSDVKCPSLTGSLQNSHCASIAAAADNGDSSPVGLSAGIAS
jgi:hypothetical protein